SKYIGTRRTTSAASTRVRSPCRTWSSRFMDTRQVERFDAHLEFPRALAAAKRDLARLSGRQVEIIVVRLVTRRFQAHGLEERIAAKREHVAIVDRPHTRIGRGARLHGG